MKGFCQLINVSNILLLLYTKKLPKMFRFWGKNTLSGCLIPENSFLDSYFTVGAVTKRFIGGSAAAAQVNIVFFGFGMT
jgi:hypothetical protein